MRHLSGELNCGTRSAATALEAIAHTSSLDSRALADDVVVCNRRQAAQVEAAVRRVKVGARLSGDAGRAEARHAECASASCAHVEESVRPPVVSSLLPVVAAGTLCLLEQAHCSARGAAHRRQDVTEAATLDALALAHDVVVADKADARAVEAPVRTIVVVTSGGRGAPRAAASIQACAAPAVEAAEESGFPVALLAHCELCEMYAASARLVSIGAKRGNSARCEE